MGYLHRASNRLGGGAALASWSIVILAIALNLQGVVGIWSLRSPFPELIEIMESDGASDRLVLTTEAHNVRLWLGRDGATGIPREAAELLTLQREATGPIYALLGPLQDFSGYTETAAIVKSEWVPIADLENPLGCSLQYPMEHNENFRESIDRKHFADGCRLSLYRAP